MTHGRAESEKAVRLSTHLTNRGDMADDGLDQILPLSLFSNKTSARGMRSADQLTDSAAGRQASLNRRRKSEGLPRNDSVIDKYRLEEILGIGGFAAVYRAKHLLLHTDVAIKLMLPRLITSHPSFAGLLCQEARLAARVQHPNVVRVYDVTQNSRISYIVLEYVDGPSLSQLIREQGALAPDEVCRIGIELASGLGSALDCGLIHRDVKPANVRLTKSGRVKIVDFGLAKLDASRFRALAPESSLFASKVGGTPGYQAPEQFLRPDSVDHSADMYSLGATLFHAATGALPFMAEDSATLARLQQNSTPKFPRHLVPPVPALLSTLILKLLAKKPRERAASYQWIIEQLRLAQAQVKFG